MYRILFCLNFTGNESLIHLKKMFVKQLICPISEERVNERVVRLNALFTMLLALAGILLNSRLALIILMADFFMRAFTPVKTTPLSFLSQKLVKLLRWKKKPIDKAPKIFAARLGFLMTLAIVLLFLTGLYLASTVITAILVVFAALELFLGFCAGCFLYTYFILPFTGQRNQ